MVTNSNHVGPDLRRRLVVLVLFGIVAGYVEAAAVVYIRTMYEPIHQHLFPGAAADDLFPLASYEQWSREAPKYLKTPVMEVTRELGTILLVALVAAGVSRGGTQWFASFVLAFGVWDLAYYLWLVVLIGWPHSLLDWDLIFAAPLPWVGPVLAPLVVAATMVTTAGIYFRMEAIRRPIRPRRGHWLAIVAGTATILAAFWWDWRNILSGGSPNPFNWVLLLTGLAIPLAGLCHAFLTTSPSEGK